MKLLLLPLLLVSAGASWYSLGSDAGPATPADCNPADCNPADCNPADCAPADCDRDDCRVEVECTGRDTCLVTCYDENDVVVCQEEIACDEPCEKACAQPCPEPGTKPCTPRSCAR